MTERITPYRHKKRVRSETSIEESMRKKIMKEEGVVLFRKNASASIYSDKSYPDRTLLGQFGFRMLVEVKKPGKEADENQAKLHKSLRKAGHVVYVIDNVPDLIDAYRKEYVLWLHLLARVPQKFLPREWRRAPEELSRLCLLWAKDAAPKASAPASRRGRAASTRP